MAISNLIEEWIREAKWHYKVKHRFDKPPLAKCYCRDCDHYHPNENKCWARGWYVAANWFCWEALPNEDERIKCKNCEKN